MKTRNRTLRPEIETLEDRQLLATLSIAADGLVTYNAGTAVLNDLSIQRTRMADGREIYFFNDTRETINVAGNLTGIVGSGTNSVQVPVTRVSSLVVNLRDQMDKLRLLSTDHPTTINAGAGEDRVQLGSAPVSGTSTLNGIRAGVQVNGGNDQDHDGLDLYDGGTLADADWYLTPGNVSRSNASSTVAVSYSQMNSVNVVGGCGRDTMRILGTLSNTKTSIYAGDGHDVIRLGDNGSLASFGSPVMLVGGRGFDWLDYSQLIQSVSVDLSARTATGVESGYLSDVEGVLGGSGDDSLTGNDIANILVGNGGRDALLGNDGRDILIGGTGRDTVGGGAGDDIVIGGMTSHDASVSRLFGLWKTWSRTDLDYTQRIQRLRDPATPGIHLTASLVSNDESDDALFGGLARDWFWANSGDTVDLDLSAERMN